MSAARPSRFSRFRTGAAAASTRARNFAGRARTAATAGATAAYASAKVAAKDPKYYIIGAVVFLIIGAATWMFGGLNDDTVSEKAKGDRKVVIVFFITTGLMLLVIAYLTKKCIALPTPAA